MRSKRSSDSAAEGVVARFLDLYFYPNIRSDWKREEEREAQLLGVDVTLETDSGSIALDEKAAVHYENKELPTFAFEINYYNEQGDLAGSCKRIFYDHHARSSVVCSLGPEIIYG